MKEANASMLGHSPSSIDYGPNGDPGAMEAVRNENGRPNSQSNGLRASIIGILRFTNI